MIIFVNLYNTQQRCEADSDFDVAMPGRITRMSDDDLQEIQKLRLEKRNKNKSQSVNKAVEIQKAAATDKVMKSEAIISDSSVVTEEKVKTVQKAAEHAPAAVQTKNAPSTVQNKPTDANEKVARKETASAADVPQTKSVKINTDPVLLKELCQKVEQLRNKLDGLEKQHSISVKKEADLVKKIKKLEDSGEERLNMFKNFTERYIDASTLLLSTQTEKIKKDTDQCLRAMLQDLKHYHTSKRRVE